MEPVKETKNDYWVKWLRILDEKQFCEIGKHGIIYSSETPEAAVKIFLSLKKLMQRLEWWEDIDGRELLDFIVKNGIGMTELQWAIRAFSLRESYLTGRLSGKTAADSFYASSREKYSMQNRITQNDEMICFIACCNDMDEADEMKLWISRLYCPEGITVDIITVEEADSIFAGYNAAMHSSDARYKVYLHQDVRIINPFFIYDVIDIFNSDSSVGMIGMVGTEAIPVTGIMWDVGRFGAVVETTYDEQQIEKTLLERNRPDGNMNASLIDGFMMITGTDIEWREDLFSGWDFYDASQCMEYLLRGYKIIVPDQVVPWCLHDPGETNLSGYEKNRKIFVDTYIKDWILSGEDE